MDERIIIIAPVGNDGRKMSELLEAHGFQTKVCFDFTECCRQVESGAGVLLFTEEALELDNVSCLFDSLKAQAPWSELPLIVLNSGGESRLANLLNVAAKAAGSLTLLERPISTSTLFRSVEVALRSRRRQYQVRDLIDAIAENNKALQQFASIIESSDDAIISKDLKGTITSWNPAAQRIFGYTSEEVIGRSVTMLIPKDRQNEEPAILQRIIQGERIDHYDTVRQRKDGSLVDISLTISPIRDANGVVGASKIARDITERKRIEGELKRFSLILEERVTERTKTLEEQAGRLRELAVELTEVEQKERRRLAEVLHDHLQQYLVAAKMRIELMEHRGHVDTNSLREARSHIDKAIDASRQLTIELRPPVLYEGGLNAGLRYLRQKMEDQHKIRVHLLVAENTEPGTDVIKAMIYQCIQELLFNTVKYAGITECFVTVRRLKSGNIEVIVEDKGLGFNVSTIGHNDKGGFGLFSIRERVKALGGEFRVSSAPGQGSVFTLIVPDKFGAIVKEAAALHEENILRDRLHREDIVVLVADDHAIVRQSIASLLLSQPFIKEVIEAENGQEAVRKADTADPDIILMDINMPVMNGLEATKILVSRNHDSKVIGLSVQTEDEMAQAMKEAGAVAYFNKGDDTRRLIETIKKIAGQSPSLTELHQ